MSERIYLDASDVPRSINVDASWFMECLHNLPATGTPLSIGEGIGHGIANALSERFPAIFGTLDTRTQQTQQQAEVTDGGEGGDER